MKGLRMKDEEQMLDSLLKSWIEYAEWVDEQNREATNHNKIIENKARSEQAFYQQQVEKFQDRVEEWVARPLWRYFDEPPVQPSNQQAFDKIEQLRQEMKPIIIPDFTGFMNFLARKKGLVDGRES